MSQILSFCALTLALSQLEKQRVDNRIQFSDETSNFNFYGGYNEFFAHLLPQQTAYGIVDISAAMNRRHEAPDYHLYYLMDEPGENDEVIRHGFIRKIRIAAAEWQPIHLESLASALRYITEGYRAELLPFNEVLTYGTSQEAKMTFFGRGYDVAETHNLMAPADTKYGYRALIQFRKDSPYYEHHPNGLVYQNLSQVHWRYPSPVRPAKVALESNHHGTGGTYEIHHIESIDIRNSILFGNHTEDVL